MFVKPLSVVVVMMLASTAACAAPVDETDGTEESSTDNGSLALRRPDAPQPLDYPVPVPTLSLQRDFRTWDLQRLRRDTKWNDGPIGNCAVHLIKLYDPGRQRDVEVAVTVCN